MQHAYYGRQRRGRCIKAMDQLARCGVDVLTITDRRCSGRRHCSIKLPDDSMYALNACQDRVSHLEAAYTCLPGTQLTLYWLQVTETEQQAL